MIFVCPECGTTFYSQNESRKHMWEFHGFDVYAQTLARIEGKLDQLLSHTSGSAATS